MQSSILKIRKNIFGLRTIILMASILFLVGCGDSAVFSPNQPYDFENTDCNAQGVGANGTDGTLDSGVFYKNYRKNTDNATSLDLCKLQELETQYYAITDDTPADTAKRTNFRNEWVQIMMKDVDVYYWKFENSFAGGKDSIQTTSETLVTGLAAASAGVGGEVAKTVFATLTATLNQFTTSLNKNFLEDQTVSLIVSTMNSDRDAINTAIISSSSKSDTEYNLLQASRDVMDYTSAGAPINALGSISNAVGSANNQKLTPQSPTTTSTLITTSTASPSTSTPVPPTTTTTSTTIPPSTSNPVPTTTTTTTTAPVTQQP